MSQWTHAICREDWDILNPGREPYILAISEPDRCCFCGEWRESGIYVRYDPAKLPNCLKDH